MELKIHLDWYWIFFRPTSILIKQKSIKTINKRHKAYDRTKIKLNITSHHLLDYYYCSTVQLQVINRFRYHIDKCQHADMTESLGHDQSNKHRKAAKAHCTFTRAFLFFYKLLCAWVLKELRCVHRGRETHLVCTSNITFIQIHNSSIFQLQFWGWNAVEEYAKWWRFVYFGGCVSVETRRGSDTVHVPEWGQQDAFSLQDKIRYKT